MDGTRLLLACLCFCCTRAVKQCQPVEDRHCHCSFSENEYIDISDLFTYPVCYATVLTYCFSPCLLIPCGSDPSKVVLCMQNLTSGVHVGLGRYTGGPDWHVNSIDPLNFTITYLNGDTVSNQTFVSDSSFSFLDSQVNGSTTSYNFQAVGPNVRVTGSSGGHSPSSAHAGVIAGSVVGSWFVLVTLTAVIVTLIIACVVKNDRKKRASYQPIPDQQPEDIVQ